MTMRSVLLGLSMALAIAGCATAPEDEARVPEYLLAARSCGILVKGLSPEAAGATSDRLQAERFWYTVNSAIVDRLRDRLETNHKVFEVAVPYAEASRTLVHAANGLAQHKCNRILSLSHDVDQDSAGPYFKFTVRVLKASRLRQQRDGYSRATTEGQYERAYRFARTREVMDTLDLGDLATRMLADMEQAGAIDAIRR
jgi:hypothetical protein